VSFPNHDYRAPYVPGPTSPAPTSTGPLYVQSGPQQYAYAPPTGGFHLPPKKKSRAGLIIGLSALGVLLLAGVIVAAVLTVPKSSNSQPGRAVAATPAACDHGRLANGQCAEDTAAPPKTYPTPAVTDFTLAIKVKKKECFGSAGCNIEFTIDLAYDGPALEPNSRWDVIYDITGGEDPQTNTLTMEIGADGVNGTYNQDGFQFISTKSSKATLKATVTSVSPA
jgi:hypothetical protein